MQGTATRIHAPQVSDSHQAVRSPSLQLTYTQTSLFEYHIARQEIVACSENISEILGAPLAALRRNGALFLAHIHALDRFRVSSLIERTITEEVSCTTTYRWLRPDTQSISLIHCRAQYDRPSGLLRGFLCDVTSDAHRFHFDGDTAINVGEFLRLTRCSGIVLDLDLSIQALHWEGDPIRISPQSTERDSDTLRVGRSLLECISDEESRTVLHGHLYRALDNPSQPLKVEWGECRLMITVLVEHAIPHAILVTFEHRMREQQLSAEVTALRERLEIIASSENLATDLLNTCQEILGYAALIQRHVPPQTITKAAIDGLMVSSRELGARVHELHTVLHSHSEVKRYPEYLAGEPVADRPSSHLATARILLASEAPRTMTPLQTTLNDAGLSSTLCSLDDSLIREHLIEQHLIRIVVLDIPRKELGLVTLVRTLRRLFPALHIVTLVPGAARAYPEFQRAGALLTLSKPLAPRELERALRGLLTFVASLKGM